MPLPLSTTSAATQRARGGPRRPPLPPLLPLPPPRLGRGADELTKPGPLRRRPELDRDSEQDLHLLLPLSSRRGWARPGEQFRPRVRAQVRTFFVLGKSAKKPLELQYPANRKTTMQDEELGHHAELECQRFARQSLNDDLLHCTLLNSVLGVNRKDLHLLHHLRPAPQSAATRKRR